MDPFITWKVARFQPSLVRSKMRSALLLLLVQAAAAAPDPDPEALPQLWGTGREMLPEVLPARQAVTQPAHCFNTSLLMYKTPALLINFVDGRLCDV